MKQRGFSLIELIVFIVIIGIVTSALFLAFASLLQDAPIGLHQTVALGLAQERMELILAQRRLQGYPGTQFQDPCNSTIVSPPAVCTALTGYSVSASIINMSNTLKGIGVTVTGTGNIVANVTLKGFAEN